MKTKNFEHNGIKTTVTLGDIEVSEVKVSDFQKSGTMTAVLKQTVTTVSSYPTKSVSNSLQDNVFDIEEYGFEKKEYPPSVRTNVVFLNVPEGSTVDSVKTRIAKYPNANLYRILSNRPILSDNQLYSITIGQRTMDEYAESQVVRYGEGEDKGELILDANGKVQYKAVFFSSTGKDDEDRRTASLDDMYLSEGIEVAYNEALLVTV